MSEFNPYAAPQAGLTSVGGKLGAGGDGGLWRKANLLVMHKQAELPDRCVKSNQPAHGGRLRRKLNWHHPGVYFTLLISIWIYVLVAIFVTKKATINIGLSEAWFARRRTAMIVSWSLVLAGIGLIVVGIVAFERTPAFGLLIALGIIGMLGAAIYGLVAARMVAASRITDEYVWLKGVHPDYLRDLPTWPHQP